MGAISNPGYKKIIVHVSRPPEQTTESEHVRPTTHSLTSSPRTSLADLHTNLNMYNQIFTTLLLSSVAYAVVIAERAGKDPVVWKSPKGGDMTVRFGDSKVYVG